MDLMMAMMALLVSAVVLDVVVSVMLVMTVVLVVVFHVVVVLVVMLHMVVMMVLHVVMVVMLNMVVAVVLMVAVVVADDSVHGLLGLLDQDFGVFVLDFQCRDLDSFNLGVDLLDGRSTAATTVHLVDAGDSRSLGEDLDLLLQFAGLFLLLLVLLQLVD